MDTCLIIGVVRGIILLFIGSLGIINVNYLSNIYVAGILIILGLMTFGASYNHREKKDLKN